MKQKLVSTLLLSSVCASFLFASEALSMGVPVPKSPPWKSLPLPTPAPTPKPTPKSNPPSAAQPIPVQPVPVQPAPAQQPPTSTYVPLWQNKHADATNWAGYVQDAIELYGTDLYKGPQDVTDFCPKYDSLGKQDRLNFWVELVAAMTKYESSFNPATRYTESTMGIDPVTKKQVVSEGLLQLSYQDEGNYKSVLPAGVCDFDFAKDQQYGLNDTRRTILDPKANLTCGIGILNRQVQRLGKIAVASGAYWAVIKTNSKYSKLTEIRSITKALPFCK